jgi:hypothetical protein
MSDRLRPLRAALGANAVFSSLTGLAMLVAGSPLASWLGQVPGWLVNGVGAALLGFAVLVGLLIRRPRPARALGIVALDFGWVLATVPLAFVPSLLTEPGRLAVLAVAAVVTVLGVLQARGIRELVRDPIPGRGTYRHCVRVRVGAPAEAMWNVVADLGRIAHFSPMLATSTLKDRAEPGENAVRVCSDAQGNTWSEVCERFDARARALQLRFVTEEPGFPYPASTMIGGWNILEDGDGSVVEVWWSLTPTVPAGWVMVSLLGLKVDSEFAAVIARMAEAAQGHAVPEAPPKLTPAYC